MKEENIAEDKSVLAVEVAVDEDFQNCESIGPTPRSKAVRTGLASASNETEVFDEHPKEGWLSKIRLIQPFRPDTDINYTERGLSSTAFGFKDEKIQQQFVFVFLYKRTNGSFKPPVVFLRPIVEKFIFAV